LAPYLAQHLELGAILGATSRYWRHTWAHHLIPGATIGAISRTSRHTGRTILYLEPHWAPHHVLSATLGATSRTWRHTRRHISYFVPHWAQYIFTMIGARARSQHTLRSTSLRSTLLSRAWCHIWYNTDAPGLLLSPAIISTFSVLVVITHVNWHRSLAYHKLQ
jgi:hypothetical protein